MWHMISIRWELAKHMAGWPGSGGHPGLHMTCKSGQMSAALMILPLQSRFLLNFAIAADRSRWPEPRAIFAGGFSRAQAWLQHAS